MSVQVQACLLSTSTLWSPTAAPGRDPASVRLSKPALPPTGHSAHAVVRLGERAYARIRKNTTSPYVKLKVAGKEFDQVKVEEMPDMKEKVATAMAAKYLMDIGVGGATEQKPGLRMARAPSLMAVTVHRLLFARFWSRWSVERVG
jgi:hypothetical protein